MEEVESSERGGLLPLYLRQVEITHVAGTGEIGFHLSSGLGLE